MASLSRKDLEGLLAAVTRIHGARRTDALRAAVLAAVRAVIPCEMASFNIIRPALGRVQVTTAPGWIESSPDAIGTVERRFLEHPVVAYFVRTRDEHSRKLSEFLSRRQFHDTALYVELYRQFGIEFQALMPIILGPSTSVGVVLSRCWTDFSERDRTLLDLLRPHVAQAYRTAQRLELAGQAGETESARAVEDAGLTPREREVLDRACRGEANAVIADALSLSPLTVKKHLEHVYDKLHVHTRGAAVARVFGPRSAA